MRLSKPIDLRGSIIDISIPTVESEEMKVFYNILPTKDNNTFLTFLFKDNADRINHATKFLTILNHPFFKFREPDDKLWSSELEDTEQEMLSKKVAFESVGITYACYKDLKEDTKKKEYKQWFNDDLINFFARWSMRDSKSKHIMASEIIDTIVTNNVKLFLESISCQDSKGNSLHLFMSQIHLYLDSHLEILSK